MQATATGRSVPRSTWHWAAWELLWFARAKPSVPLSRRCTVHPTDGSLLALIHGESSPGRAAEIEAHLESCPLCARKMDELRTGDAEIARLLAALDRPVPQLAPPGGNARPRRIRRTLLAASIGVLVAGAAAAAVA